MSRRGAALAASVLLAAGALVAAPRAQAPPPAAEEWRSFEAAWSATGHRQTMPTGGGRDAAIVRLSGSVVLTAGSGLGRGFRGEIIGFDDGRALAVGRWLWTDERGDRIFGEMRGEPVQTGRRFMGTITGGTGRYAGITGSYAFTWHSVVAAEDGVVQGRTVGLKGRYRRGRVQP
jgi:hypothetical protein